MAFFESTVEAEQITKRTCPDFSSEILAVEGFEFKRAEKKRVRSYLFRIFIESARGDGLQSRMRVHSTANTREAP